MWQYKHTSQTRTWTLPWPNKALKKTKNKLHKYFPPGRCWQPRFLLFLRVTSCLVQCSAGWFGAVPPPPTCPPGFCGVTVRRGARFLPEAALVLKNKNPRPLAFPSQPAIGLNGGRSEREGVSAPMRTPHVSTRGGWVCGCIMCLGVCVCRREMTKGGAAAVELLVLRGEQHLETPPHPLPPTTSVPSASL